MPSPSIIAQQEEAEQAKAADQSYLFADIAQEDIGMSVVYDGGPGRPAPGGGAWPRPDWEDEDLQLADPPPTTVELIREVCDEIKELLVTKNEQYGDSAVDPVRIFSRADPEEQLRVRIDDKLSRLARGDDRIESDGEVVNDLIGYLILLRVSARL
jgi:hypothetical protein